MPKLELEPVWSLKLKTRGRELTLIRKALRGELTEADREEAKELELSIARQTVQQSRQQLEHVEKLARNIGEEA